MILPCHSPSTVVKFSRTNVMHVCKMKGLSLILAAVEGYALNTETIPVCISYDASHMRSKHHYLRGMKIKLDCTDDKLHLRTLTMI